MKYQLRRSFKYSLHLSKTVISWRSRVPNLSTQTDATVLAISQIASLIFLQNYDLLEEGHILNFCLKEMFLEVPGWVLLSSIVRFDSQSTKRLVVSQIRRAYWYTIDSSMFCLASLVETSALAVCVHVRVEDHGLIPGADKLDSS